jgi:hypothetical protein
MVKATKQKRRKTSSAWKNLKKIHQKGPKRVRIDKPRKRKGIDPLTVRANVKFVRVFIQKVTEEDKKMTIIIFNRVFQEMGLYAKNEFTMEKDRLTRAGAGFKKLFDAFGHNDYVRKVQREMKLSNIVGRCLIFAEHFKTFDTTLYITPTSKEKEKQLTTAEHVRQLFEQSSAPRTRPKHNVEYM